MPESCKIYIDRLKDGRHQKIDASLSSDFLDIEEEELVFSHPVALKGEAYLTDGHLIIHLEAITKTTRPCAICNQPTTTALHVKNFYHTEELKDIPTAIFDFQEILREAILVELPLVIECHSGHCPERATIAPFMSTQERRDHPTYFPFTDIDT